MTWPFGHLPMFGYDLIMADPPWSIETWSEAGLKKAPQAHYACMSLEDIKALPVGHLAAPDCLLWLWCIAPMIPDALETIDAWGFRFSTMGTWVKTTERGKLAFGTGWRLRGCAEFFIVATIGKPKTTQSTRNALVDVRREHSRKPVSSFRAAERLMPKARRVELFSREGRDGWDAWGNEAGKFNATPPQKPSQKADLPLPQSEFVL